MSIKASSMEALILTINQALNLNSITPFTLVYGICSIYIKLPQLGCLAFKLTVINSHPTITLD